jgi:hypothetical protein
VGDEGDGTVSGFVLRPLGGPGSPYFQSSYPCLIVWSSLVIRPPILPSCLDFLFPPHAPRHHIPPSSIKGKRPHWRGRVTVGYDNDGLCRPEIGGEVAEKGGNPEMEVAG